MHPIVRALTLCAAAGFLWLGGVQAFGQSAETTNADTRRKLFQIKEAVKESQDVARDAAARERGLGTASPDALAIQEATRALKEAEKAVAKLPTKLAPVPKMTPVFEPPAGSGQDDALERLRRNQKALTDQRIGDFIILQTK